MGKKVICSMIITLLFLTPAQLTMAKNFLLVSTIHIDKFDYGSANDAGSSWNDNVILDFHYDAINERALLVTQSEIYEYNERQNTFELFTDVPWPYNPYASTFRPKSSSIYLIATNGRIDEYNMFTGELHEQPLYTSPMAVPDRVIDITYNSKTDQILVVGILDGIVHAFAFSFNSYDWSWSGEDGIITPGDIGEVSVNPETNQAILVFQYPEAYQNDLYTYTFDFETFTWDYHLTPKIPKDIYNFEFEYYAEIDQYVFMGGYEVETNFQNHNIWLYDPLVNKWAKTFVNPSILNIVTEPRVTYNPLNDSLIVFAREKWSVNNYYVSSLLITSVDEDAIRGYNIDVGMSPEIFLLGVILPIFIGIAVFSVYIYKNRKTIITR
jgi:hypothetical protein